MFSGLGLYQIHSFYSYTTYHRDVDNFLGGTRSIAAGMPTGHGRLCYSLSQALRSRREGEDSFDFVPSPNREDILGRKGTHQNAILHN